MSRDRREDTGAYYPGGTVIPVAPQQRATQVPVTDVGDLGDRYTLADVKAKVNQVVQVLAQRTSAIVLMLAALSAAFSASADLTVQTARLDALYNDATVVTNVSGAATEPGVVSNIVESYGYATTDYVDDATNELSSTVSGLSSQVSGLTPTVSGLAATSATHTASISAISTYLSAEDAHFVSTNFDSTVATPEAYVEVKVNGSWLEIWREMTRWNEFTGINFNWNTWGGFASWGSSLEDELAQKADRAWGLYDSETGGYSPEGYTQISSSNILIAANMAYQRTVTTGGAVWVLQCNNGHATLNGATNGCFRISDGDGNVQFEVVSGGGQELGADAWAVTNDTTTTPNTLRIYYSVIADAHPTLKISNDLTTWKSETDSACLANVTWTGTSGAYVAAVQPKATQPKLFIKATYMSGGASYMRAASAFHVSGVEGNVYDFADMRGVYKALRDVVQALGGSVTNYPTFTP